LRVIMRDDDIGLPDLERLAASEEWAWVQRVHLPLFAFDQLFRRAALPLLSNLSELAVTCRTGSNSWWARFVEFLSQPDRAMLSSLEVFGGVITTAALATLSGPDPFRRLTALTLCDMGLRCEGCEVFAGGTGLQSLRWLRLEGNLIDSTGAAALARARWMPGVSALLLNFKAIETDGAAAPAPSPFLENVRYLNLSRHPIWAPAAPP